MEHKLKFLTKAAYREVSAGGEVAAVPSSGELRTEMATCNLDVDLLILSSLSISVYYSSSFSFFCFLILFCFPLLLFIYIS